MTFYNPNSLSPSLNQELIYNEDNIFTWTVNGIDSQQYYQIYIYDMDNNEIYNSTKITSSDTSHTVPSSTFNAGTLYKWKVNSYYDSTNFLSSKWEIFTGISTPNVTLSATPTSQQTYEFGFLYNNPQSIAVKTYHVYLYEGDTLIDESDDIYPSSLVSNSSTPLTYTFSGMQSDIINYYARCIVTNQDNYLIDSGKIIFSINYTYPDTVTGLTASVNNDNGSVTLDWINIVQVLPTITGTYEYLDDTFTVEHNIKSEFDSGTFYHTESFVNGVQLTGYETWSDIPTGTKWNDL
jgi:hypothetical protein